jgi:hypothetical protein
VSKRNLLPLLALALLLLAGVTLAADSTQPGGLLPGKWEAIISGVVAVVMLVVHALSEPGWKTTLVSFTFWLGLAQAVNVVIAIFGKGIEPNVQEWIGRLLSLLMMAFFGRTLSWNQRFKAVFAKKVA